MNLRHAPGELRIAVLGDLLRNPLTGVHDTARRLEVDNPDVVRMTLKRMVIRGWVRRHEDRFLLTDAGRLYIRRMRQWLEA